MHQAGRKREQESHPSPGARRRNRDLEKLLLFYPNFPEPGKSNADIKVRHAGEDKRARHHCTPHQEGHAGGVDKAISISAAPPRTLKPRAEHVFVLYPLIMFLEGAALAELVATPTIL